MKFKFYALWLCVICIGVFIIQILFSGFTEALLLNGSSWVQLWRFVTSIFLHGDIGHLLYNMFALALFGTILEKLIGGKRLLIVFFATGILANLIAVNFYTSSLGASGAIFGLIGALIVVRPGMLVWAFGLPMPIFIAGILWVAGDLIGIFVPSNIANIAHLSGMFLGLVFGFFYRQSRPKIRRQRIPLDENYVRNWEDFYLR